jgi:hypothetical protein
VALRLEPTLIGDMGDHELRMAVFQNTEDNQLPLMSDVPKGPDGRGWELTRWTPRTEHVNRA